MLSLFSIISKLLTLFFRINSKHNNSVINNIVQEISTAKFMENQIQDMSHQSHLFQKLRKNVLMFHSYCTYFAAI